MKHLTLAMVLALAATSAMAKSKEDYQVIRAGDESLTCAQLGEEINPLTAEVQKAQADAAKRAERSKAAKGMFGGLASSAMMMAPSMIGGQLGGMGGMGGMMAQQAMSGVAQQAMSAQRAPQAQAEAPAAVVETPQSQRLTHLQTAYQARCSGAASGSI